MFLDATDHSKNVFDATAFETYPYKHLVVDHIFEQNLYEQIKQNRIETDFLSPLVEGGTVGAKYSDKRFVLSLSRKLTILGNPQRRFWEGMFDWLDTDFKQLVVKKFDITQPTKLRVLYTRDFPGYQLGPHTDNKAKRVTILIYIPSQQHDLEIGTTVFYPKLDGVQTCEGNQHYTFDEFNVYKTIKYVPNRLFGFVKTNNSFHGVLPFNQQVERDILIYDLSSC